MVTSICLCALAAPSRYPTLQLFGSMYESQLPQRIQIRAPAAKHGDPQLVYIGSQFLDYLLRALIRVGRDKRRLGGGTEVSPQRDRFGHIHAAADTAATDQRDRWEGCAHRANRLGS